LGKERTEREKNQILNEVDKLLSPAYQIGPCVAGHDIWHIQRMIAIAKKISDPKEVDQFLLQIAIYFHNIDRTTYFNFKCSEERNKFIRNALLKIGLEEDEIKIIIEAVEKHNKLNEESDTPLLRDLKDIDRLDVGAIGILRIGAFRGRNLPIMVPGDFFKVKRSTKETNIESLMHDLQRCLEWEKMLRNPRAKKLGKRRFSFMRKFQEEVKRELKEIGLI
jgi:HD superfamily phosphodiesterase